MYCEGGKVVRMLEADLSIDMRLLRLGLSCCDWRIDLPTEARKRLNVHFCMLS
jgi:hypothetical protein